MTSIAELLAQIPEREDGTSTLLSSDEYEEQRAKWANDLAGNLPGPHCPECNDKGYIVERRGVELVSVECRCMKKRRSIRNMEKSGLGELLNEKTFDSFRTPEPWHVTAKKAAMDYLSSDHSKWFVLSGEPGSGKTHLCTAICGGLLDSGLEVRYMLWRDSATRIKALVNDSEAYSRLVEPLKRVPVLYIDDFLKTGKEEGQKKEKITVGDINFAFELLNARYNSRALITIISTQYPLGRIMSIDDAIGSRIYERSKGYYMQLEGKDKNWRIRK